MLYSKRLVRSLFIQLKRRNVNLTDCFFFFVAEIPQIENCPKWCTCDEQLQFIDCSNRSLSEIPKNLPNTTLHINLSHNDIREIHESDLTNLTVVREVILKNNNIQNINGSVRHFKISTIFGKINKIRFPSSTGISTTLSSRQSRFIVEQYFANRSRCVRTCARIVTANFGQ